MKKIFTWALLLSGPWAWAQEPVQVPGVPVITDTVKQTEVVPTMPVTGNVHSQNALQITAAITGQLEFVAEPGTALAPGDVIVKMNTQALELQQAEQQALIKRATAQLNYLETTLRRQQDLVKAQSIAANAVEQSESQRDVAASDLEVAQLRLAQIQEQLERSVIKAQFHGVVSQRDRREGETVAAGTVLAAVTDMDNLEIRAQVPLRYAKFIQVGQSLDLFAHEINQQGVVKSLVPAGNNRNQSYELRLQFTNTHDLTIGQLVSVSVPMYQARSSLVVNQDALVLRENGTFVFKVSAANTVEQVSVKANENVGDLIAIDADLKAGDQVVIRGADNLQPGTAVEIKNSQG
ncbi:efflux RND transporter periplasmic adaptor subunit [Marinicella meishanensis]|uniref:efflux RND transporter periplasmic adaptor subunit n=1 Tax=Marinicella meishanensis TaxID=2873263 RepID=UPI001CBBBCF0|nr:efflux RND transporter periplasmic adaptor subunit [Marinicella sp. NBU2979]